MKILIVDDSVFAQKVAQNAMKKAITNAKFQFASKVSEGFEKYVEYRPDLCIIDLLMPETSGKDLIEKIFRFDKDAKIVVVTADVQKSVKEELKEMGILAFVNKPIDMGKARKIAKVVGK